jgi:Flp pilus assembly secretin CpaC
MQGQASESLNVPMNRAVVVESDVPFAELSIANPGIADISTLSDKSIYVLGKAPGRTTLTLLSPEGTLISNVDVHVTPDIAEFKERLQQILPGETSRFGPRTTASCCRARSPRPPSLTARLILPTATRRIGCRT